VARFLIGLGECEPESRGAAGIAGSDSELWHLASSVPAWHAQASVGTGVSRLATRKGALGCHRIVAGHEIDKDRVL